MQITENLGVMYGQIFPDLLGSSHARQNSNFPRDPGPTGRQKIQICSDRPIKPQKIAIVFGLAPKNGNFNPIRRVSAT